MKKGKLVHPKRTAIRKPSQRTLKKEVMDILTATDKEFKEISKHDRVGLLRSLKRLKKPHEIIAEAIKRKTRKK